MLLMVLILSIGTLGHGQAANTWSLTGSMSTARHGTTRRRCCQTAGCSSAAGTARQRPFLDHSAEIYDSAQGTWSLTGSMSISPHHHTATALSDGRVLVSGGFGQRQCYLASAEIYDPALGTWSLTGSMSTARYSHTATVLPDGRVLVSGGHNGESSS